MVNTTKRYKIFRPGILSLVKRYAKKEQQNTDVIVPTTVLNKDIKSAGKNPFRVRISL
jgi:hypothetical protein